MFCKLAFDAATNSLGEPAGRLVTKDDLLSLMDATEGQVFLNGLYTQGSDPVVITEHLYALLDALRERKQGGPIVCTTSEKQLKNPVTEEIARESQVNFPKGWYNANNKHRVEGTFAFNDDDMIVWQSMVFPFSNFGHTKIDMKVEEIVSLTDVLNTIGDKPRNLAALQLVMKIKVLTVETLIQAVLKILAAALMPVKLGTEDAKKFFKTNVAKLDKITVNDQPIRKELIIRTEEELTEGKKHSYGGKECDDLDALVSMVNNHIFETLTFVKDDKTVKALGNALNIDPVFFGSVGNGTPYPLGKPGRDSGANTNINAAGILLRCYTYPPFLALMNQLRLRGVLIQESAAHWRGTFYYIDNTYGGGFGVQLAPPQEGITFKGKEHVFYNAMGQGYALAQEFLGQMQNTDDKGEIASKAGEFILQALERIVAAC